MTDLAREGTPHTPADVTAPGVPLFDLDTYGAVGLQRWGGYIGEEEHQRLSGRRAMRVFREMAENDATVGAVLYAIRSLVASVEFRVKPANESTEGREVQAFVESALGDMSHTWEAFLDEVQEALVYGWAAFERVYKIRRGPDDPDPRFRSKYADGRIGIRKLATRAQTALEKWEFAGDGSLRGMWQNAAPDYLRLYVPIEKLVLYRPRAPRGNPEGRSILRSAYRAWFMLKRLQEIEAVGIERDLSGLPVMQVPAAVMAANAPPDLAAVRSSLETMVQKIRRDEREGVVIPAEQETDADGQVRITGYKFGLLSTGGRRAVDVRPAITDYQRDIARAALAEFIFLGNDPNGSRSLADSKTTTFATALGAWLENIVATTQQHVIAPLVALNGWPADLCPTLEHGDIETPDLVAVADYVTKLTASGLLSPDPTLERYLRATGRLPALEAIRIADTAPGSEAPAVPAPPVRNDAPATAPAGPPVGADTPPAPTPPELANVAASAMNGAQVASLKELLMAAVAGELPLATVRAMLPVAFPSVTGAQVDAMLAGIVPRPAPAPVAAPAPPPAG